MKAYAYLRVSSVNQVAGDGLDRQEQSVFNYAKRSNIRIIKTFRDEGVSGTLKDRPALASLFVALEDSDIKTVVIEKLDRLARDLMVQEAIIHDLQRHGYTLISVAEGADLLGSDPSRKLIRQLFGAVAEYDKSMLVQRMKIARDRIRAKHGKCEGRKGYTETAEGRDIVAYIKSLRKTKKHYIGLTWQQIADRLNNEGIKTLQGHSWTAQRVERTAKSGV